MNTKIYELEQELDSFNAIEKEEMSIEGLIDEQ